MEKKILRNKIFLYLTEFFAGMSVMAVELGASRLLAPYFSSSQIVWTIIIGTIMIAMALGNIYGGRSADRDPDPDRLYKRILFAACWIAMIPVLGKYIILGISALMVFAVNTNFLIWAAFAACMIIFVYPLFLLGTVTPSLAKYTVSSLDDSGKTVGTLGAFNTIGSIIGTFLPTFVTIPTVGTAVTFLIFSGVLLVLGLIYFLSEKACRIRCIVSLVIFTLASILGSSDSFAFWENNLVYEGESVYNYLQVKEDDREVILSTNVLFGVQSVLMKEDRLTGMYYDYAMLAPLMANAEVSPGKDVLILGMGTGTYATQCDRYFNGSGPEEGRSAEKKLTFEGVELDGDITGLAREYFDLDESIPVTTYDGRAFLNVIDKKYDVIMVDAYQDITIPFQMSSREFFSLVKSHLKEGGVMVVNMNMRGREKDNAAVDKKGPGGSINRYLQDTIASVFPYVYTVDVPWNTNRELFASMDEGAVDIMYENIELIKDPEFKGFAAQAGDRLARYEATDCIFTDDKAPVELLGMRVIDELITDEVTYYKDIYEKDGINGVMNSL